VAVTAGYFLHSRWSFKDHGTREPGGPAAGEVRHRPGLVGLALNASDHLGGDRDCSVFRRWVPLHADAVALATIFTFILNRWLVFA
jgi:hypothetical protein